MWGAFQEGWRAVGRRRRTCEGHRRSGTVCDRRLYLLHHRVPTALDTVGESKLDTVGESNPITPLPLTLVATPRNGISVFSHAVGPSPRRRIVQYSLRPPSGYVADGSVPVQCAAIGVARRPLSLATTSLRRQPARYTPLSIPAFAAAFGLLGALRVPHVGVRSIPVGHALRGYKRRGWHSSDSPPARTARGSSHCPTHPGPGSIAD
jgi:hypothetical protein